MRRVTVTVAVVAALALGACSDDAAAPPSSSAASTTSAAPATTPSSPPSSTTPPSTVAPTTAAPTTAPATTAPATPTSAVPAAVREVSARPGGGSGEIVVTWRGVAGAGGYRVLRSGTASGPFEIGADLDVAGGRLTKANDVTNVVAVGDGTFTYVEVPVLANTGAQRWYRVVAYSSGGAAAASPTVCGAPPGAPAC